jgi:hypothetical protein
METALSATMLLLALWSVAVYVDDGRRLWALAASALAAALARPESGYVLAATSVALLAWLVFAQRRRRDVDAASGSPRRSAIACAVVGVALAAPAAFRQAFFDQPVPQPVRAKVGGLEIERGLDYLWRWGARPYVLVLAVLVAVWLLRLRGDRRSLPALLTLAIGAHVGFVVLSGGDWMEAGRFMVPAVALAAVMTGVVINRNRLALAAIVLLQLAGVLHVAANDSTGLPFWSDLQPHEVREAAGTLDAVASRNRVHARDALFLPVLDGAVAQLHDQLDRPVTIASGQAGFVPYGLATERYGEFRFIDLGNLSTRNFAACDEGLRRGLLGLAMSMPYWIAHVDECELPLPDLLYQLGRFEATDPSVQRAFVLVEQVDVGPIRASSKLLAGADVSSAEFLAVRRDLADLLDAASDG